ncbi:MAG: futalosine hydrolase [Proteobacteria bacterium]|nr:futalosine hydrolase [Pseudomonadota bacterium]MBU1715199.1 futalosine hydrolase [Pseudomonadota bacterium]
MFLLVSATDIEMKPLREKLGALPGVDFLVTGIGLVETVLSLTRYLAKNSKKVEGIIGFGVAGAYFGSECGLLDICLADREVLGDLGVCFGDQVVEFDVPDLPLHTEFILQNNLFSLAHDFLTANAISFKTGTFVTVNSVSGTATRGGCLRTRFGALCENMEGAAVARVSAFYHLPCLEIRCVSNMVEDRNRQNWQVDQAALKCAGIIGSFVQKIVVPG